MSDLVTNLASAPTTPMIILAPATEFITLTGGMPTAAKMRCGTEWLGLNGTYGTITKASLKPLGDSKTQPSGSPGGVRAKYVTGLGFGLSLTVHNDRGSPALRLMDRFSCWVDSGTGTPAIMRFHVEGLSEDMGDEDTVTLEITAEHRKGLDDLSDTQVIRATVDEKGRVVEYSSASKFGGSVANPHTGLPTGPDGSVAATWTRSGSTITVTSTGHGLITSNVITIYQSSDETATPVGTETVTNLTANTFTFVGVATGATSGTLTYLP